MKLLLTLLVLCSFKSLSSQSLSSIDIINKSISFHDPKAQFSTGDYTLHFEESRPNGSTRKTKVRLATHKQEFEIHSHREGHLISQKILKKDTVILLDNKKEMNIDTIKKYRLHNSRAGTMKDYYLYLWHLPMKLLDPGTIVSSNVKQKEFNDYSCYEIKITYNESVGHDTWYYYFDTSDYQMRGYRFYHDESKNDGEYIYLNRLTTLANIKIPAERKWYTHKEDKFLGSDNLVKITK